MGAQRPFRRGKYAIGGRLNAARACRWSRHDGGAPRPDRPRRALRALRAGGAGGRRPRSRWRAARGWSCSASTWPRRSTSRRSASSCSTARAAGRRSTRPGARSSAARAPSCSDATSTTSRTPTTSRSAWRCSPRSRAGARSVQAEKRYLAADGSVVHVAESTTARRDEHGRIIRYVAHIRDATARDPRRAGAGRVGPALPRRARERRPRRAQHGRERHDHLLQPGAVPARGLAGRGAARARLVRDLRAAGRRRGARPARRGHRHRPHRAPPRGPDPHPRAASGARSAGRTRSSPTRPAGPVGTTSLGEDITEKMAAQRALAHRATHDPLTGLANRTLMDERLAQAIADPDAAGGRDRVRPGRLQARERPPRPRRGRRGAARGLGPPARHLPGAGPGLPARPATSS